MSGGRIVVIFPKFGEICCCFAEGQTIAEFAKDAEADFAAEFGWRPRVEQLLHPDFLPEELSLPFNGDAVGILRHTPSVVAKLAASIGAPVTRAAAGGAVAAPRRVEEEEEEEQARTSESEEDIFEESEEEEESCEGSAGSDDVVFLDKVEPSEGGGPRGGSRVAAEDPASRAHALDWPCRRRRQPNRWWEATGDAAPEAITRSAILPPGLPDPSCVSDLGLSDVETDDDLDRHSKHRLFGGSQEKGSTAPGPQRLHAAKATSQARSARAQQLLREPTKPTKPTAPAPTAEPEHAERKGTADGVGVADGAARNLRERAEALMEVLQGTGYSCDDVVEVLARCGDDEVKVKAFVEGAVASHRSGAGAVADGWATHVTRRTQRERELRRRRRCEQEVMGGVFGDVLKGLLDHEALPGSLDGQARTGKASKSAAAGKGQRQLPRVAEIRTELREAAGATDEGRRLKAEVEQMLINSEAPSHAELRRFLESTKAFSTVSEKTFKAIAERAVDALVHNTPKCLADCQAAAFWVFKASEPANKKRFPADGFFHQLSAERGPLLRRLPELHPNSVAFVLGVMKDARHTPAAFFNEAARWIIPRCGELDRDLLGSLAATYSDPAHMGVFKAIAKEVVQRCEEKENPRCLSPTALQSILGAFGRAAFHDREAIEAMLVRSVGLFDADPAEREITDFKICAPAITNTGKVVPAHRFRFSGLVKMCKGLLLLKDPDVEFFNDVADYAILSTLRMGTIPKVEFFQFPALIGAFTRAKLIRPDLIAALQDCASKHRGWTELIGPRLREAVINFRLEEAKSERIRSAPQQRRRGAMGRALVQPEVQEAGIPRSTVARMQRMRDDAGADRAQPDDDGGTGGSVATEVPPASEPHTVGSVGAASSRSPAAEGRPRERRRTAPGEGVAREASEDEATAAAEP